MPLMPPYSCLLSMGLGRSSLMTSSDLLAAAEQIACELFTHTSVQPCFRPKRSVRYGLSEIPCNEAGGRQNVLNAAVGQDEA